MDIKKLIKQARKAIEDEISAVQKNPRRDVLSDPEPVEDGEDFTFSFPTSNQAFQYVEELLLISEEPPVPGFVVKTDEKSITIRFEEMPVQPFLGGEVEWVNDFVLTRTLEQLEKIEDQPEDKGIRRLEEIFGKNDESDEVDDDDFPDVRHDGFRNESQQEAIIKAMTNRVTYVWGPPGTGKTATLGFIIANYIDQGKKVLFASNTNRAVDVGLMSALTAIQDMRVEINPEYITRFGDAALENDTLTQLSFDEQLERRRMELLQESQQESREDVRRKMLVEMIEKLQRNGKEVPGKIQHEYDTLLLYADDEERKTEELASELEMLRFRELNRKKLLATTLARVCTSDLMQTASFDAVVIDEASMANIPYLLVLAAKSKKHIVFAGDPMQLPPIAMTTNAKHRDFLERDVYTMVSGAESMEELFSWKDKNPGITCFFDTQYRLEDDLAEVISSVFYDGRLKSGKADINKTSAQKEFGDDLIEAEKKEQDISVYLVNSARYNPWIETPKSEYGFRPVNEVHRKLTLELVKRLMFREHLPASEIGIIVPFRSVVWDYRKALYEEGYGDVEVGTIHTFQGREKEAILFDLVMSGQGPGQPHRHFSVRPFDEDKNGLSVPRLLNVAFSRAKSRMVVIADMNHVRNIYSGKFLGNLLEKLRLTANGKKS
ncbi:MAG: DNA2/NAM7 family helicase [Balneolia bacterium]|nr:DNA2/NAM7 family helicase [Balneolia bacterium]